MIFNLIVLALIVGIVIGLNLVMLVPLFTIQVVNKFGFFKNSKLSYEKFESIDSSDDKLGRSRYVCRHADNSKEICSGRVAWIMMAISVSILEFFAVGIYFIAA